MSNWTLDEYALPLCKATDLPMSVDVEGDSSQEILRVFYDGIPVASAPGRLAPSDLEQWIPPILLQKTGERARCLALLREIDEPLGHFCDALRQSPAFAEQLPLDAEKVLWNIRLQCASLLLSETLTPLLHEHIKRFASIVRRGR
ncbi:MAG TPA: hypothetical protein VI873_04065 [Candidatus Peribacteraceae bacterium]|nr:hypothetical protein [Candidatus Peribacteraceae bacterium]